MASQHFSRASHKTRKALFVFYSKCISDIFREMVGIAGIEPTLFRLSVERFSRLSYTPMKGRYDGIIFPQRFWSLQSVHRRVVLLALPIAVK